MKFEDLNQLKNKFVHYVGQFNSSNDSVQTHYNIKKHHTFRVIENIVELSQNVLSTTSDRYLAEVIALFHDIGRFEQYNTYGSFSDINARNHAEIGVEVLKKEGFLKCFDKETQQFIIDVILLHNTPYLPKGLTPRKSLYAKLLRDADKLDIFKVVIDYDLKEGSENGLIPDKYTINDTIYNRFIRKTVVEIDMAEEKYDFYLLRLSWIFDLNFQTSFQLLDKRNYINYLFSRIPKSYRLNSIHSIVKEELMSRIFSPVA